MILGVMKFLTCAVSLMLTALFALTFSGLSLDAAPLWTLSEWLTAVLLILVGVCIDGGKYLFWAVRVRGTVYSVSRVLGGVFVVGECGFFHHGRCGTDSERASVDA